MIIHLKTTQATKEGLAIANAIRNSQIGQAKGGLLVNGKTDAEPKYLIEKLIDGDPLPDSPTPASKIKWKPEGVVVLIGPTIGLLDTFEKLVPGFGKHFGPVVKMTVSNK